MSIKIDCKGLVCPQPVLKAREALTENPGEIIEVVVDNEASKNNVERFARSQHCEVSSQPLTDGCFAVTLVPGENTEPGPVTEADYSCEVSTGGGLVYVIASDTMGRGDDELGWGLLQTYVQTIKDVDPLPTKIIFYNGGVRIVSEQSGALEALRALQEKGVSILVCGTCLDFFKLTAKLQVGQISNMFEIMSTINSADKVMSPQ